MARRGWVRFAVVCVIAVTAAQSQAAVSNGSAGHAAPDATDHRAASNSIERSEPALAVSPHDGNWVVSAANDSEKGDIAAFVSRDGGRTFPIESHLPLPPRAAAGSDPGLAFDSSGRLFASYVGFSTSGSSLRTDVGGLVVARSDDGGRSWGEPVLAVPNKPAGAGCAFADFPSIGVDQRTGMVAVAWQSPDAPCGRDKIGTLLTSRSLDHGRTWSAPQVLPTPAWPHYQLTPTIHVSSTGLVLVSYMDQDGALAPRVTNCPQSSGPVSYRLAVSRDHGRTFVDKAARADVCANLHSNASPAFGLQVASATGATYRTPLGTDAAEDAVHRVLLQVTMEADPTTAFARLRISRSKDGGKTWSVGGELPAQAAEQQLFPRLSVSEQGRTTVLWLAQSPGGSYVATASVSTDGGRTWGSEQPVATMASSVRHPFSMGYAGDYLANVTGPDGRAHLAWTDFRMSGNSELPINQIWTRAI